MELRWILTVNQLKRQKMSMMMLISPSVFTVQLHLPSPDPLLLLQLVSSWNYPLWIDRCWLFLRLGLFLFLLTSLYVIPFNLLDCFYEHSNGLSPDLWSVEKAATSSCCTFLFSAFCVLFLCVVCSAPEPPRMLSKWEAVDDGMEDE